MQAHEELEQKFGDWLSVPNVVACSSGTAALHLALESMCLPRGEVILCDYNMVACARAVVLAGLKPVFVDCGDDLLIDPSQVADAVCNNTVAILATHVYGRQCDMDALNAIADRHDLHVIEDLAEAHGVQPHRKSDAACWSFYKNKIVAGEEGGAVSFTSPAAARLAKQLRTLGFTEAHDYTHVPRGHNYRLSNIHAELVLQSLAGVRSSLYYRRQVEEWYNSFCPLGWMTTNLHKRREAVWVYDVRVPGMLPEMQTAAVRRLREAGIEARYGFKPMTSLREFYDANSLNSSAAAASREVIYLPVTLRTTRSSVQRAMELLQEILPCR